MTARFCHCAVLLWVFCSFFMLLYDIKILCHCAVLLWVFCSMFFHAILCQQDSVSLCCAVIGVLSYVFSCYPMSARFCVSVLCCYRCFVLCF